MKYMPALAVDSSPRRLDTGWLSFRTTVDGSGEDTESTRIAIVPATLAYAALRRPVAPRDCPLSPASLPEPGSACCRRLRETCSARGALPASWPGPTAALLRRFPAPTCEPFP